MVHDVAALSLPGSLSPWWSPAVSLAVVLTATDPLPVLAVLGRHPAPGSSQPGRSRRRPWGTGWRVGPALGPEEEARTQAVAEVVQHV